MVQSVENMKDDKELAEKIARFTCDNLDNFDDWTDEHIVKQYQSIIKEHFKKSVNPDLEAEARELLSKTILEYNKTVNRIGKFQFSERESKMFADMMSQFAQQVIDERIPSEEEMKKEILSILCRYAREIPYIHIEDATDEIIEFITSKLKQNER